MSRSNRGPRADIALLRKLKDPNFSPASLAEEGQRILDKANKLKGFVAEQRGKLGVSAAKTEWLLAFQQLQTEHDDAERELKAYLQQLAEQQPAEHAHASSRSHHPTAIGSTEPGGAGKSGINDGSLSEPQAVAAAAAEAMAELSEQAQACRVERAELRARVRGLSAVHGSFRAYGATPELTREAAALKDAMAALQAELAAGASQLAADASALSAELRDAWPSALPAGIGGGGDALLLSAAAAAAGGGGGSSDLVALPLHDEGDGGGGADGEGGACEEGADDGAELERMLARYPLASPDVKARVRGVFWELQARYLERVEAWRVESERAAAALAAAPAATGAGRLPSTAAAAASPGGAVASSGRGGTRLPRPGGLAQGSGRGPGGGGGALQPVVAPRRPYDTASRGGDIGGRTGGAEAPGASRTASASSVASSAAAGVTPRAAGAADEHGGARNGGGSSSSAAAGGGWAFAGYGGWSAEEHSAFVRHRERLLKGGAQGAKGGREAVMARIASLLPGGRTAAEVGAHDEWTLAARLAARRRHDLDGGWRRERRTFVADSAALLEECEALFFVRAEEAADRLVAELLRERAHEELQERRVERAREEEVAAAERAAAEAAEAAARVAAEAAERRERAAAKELVAAYRADLARDAALAAAAAVEAERAAAAAAAEAMVHHRERVEWRHAEYLVRQDKAKERQQEEEAAEAAREARLARLRALVAPEVQADPERLLAPTAASAAAAAAAAEAAALAEAGDVPGAFRPVHGYTTDQVVKDQRFKIMEALARAGLHETDYGRRVIAAAKPAHAPRPDNFTSEQRAALLR